MEVKKIFIIAGEASGDLLGAGVMSALLPLPLGEGWGEGSQSKLETSSSGQVPSPQPSPRGRGSISFIGIGGARMQAQGLQSIFPMQELSVMGFAEVLPHAWRILKRLRQTVAAVEAANPDILLTIDSPGFCFRLVKKLRQRGRVRPLFIHYVAPSVWAYKPERAAKTAKLFDKLLVLFPFEPAYFIKEGLETIFVGHPIANISMQGEGENFRKKHNIPPEQKILAMFPGSRMGELKYLLPIYKETAQLLADNNLQIVMPILPQLVAFVTEKTKNWASKIIIISDDQEKKDALAASSCALVKSGTISLEVAKAGVPMVTCYKAHPISVWLVRKLIKIQHVNLINIILGKTIIPEFLQENCTAEKLSAALNQLINSPQMQTEQKQAFTSAINQLKASDGIDTSTKIANILASSTISR